MDCLLGVVRALRMGSCLSVDGCSHSSAPSSPSSPASGTRRSRRGSRRRPQRSSSRREEQVHRIPGRMFLNGASAVASLFTQQGKKGTNQDAMIVWENFGSRNDTIFCGIFDGHGPYGHIVAKKVRDVLPLKLTATWESEECNTSEASSPRSLREDNRASINFEENGDDSQIFMTLKESFLKAFRIMDKELRQHPDIDCFYSGTTAVTLIKQGQQLYIGNVGDSRAVLGTRDQDNSIVAVQLTVDLKPNLPNEAERIRLCRGRVFALKDEPDVARVWLPNNNVPGLAMARALGDFCLKDYGLISVPDISYRQITERDEFIVLATDGVWDVLSNKEVVDIVASAPARASAARSLVESAVKAWKLKYPTSRTDDCAVICLFLQSQTSNISTDVSIHSQVGEPLTPCTTDGNKQGPSSSTSHNGDDTVPTVVADVNVSSVDGSNWSIQQGVARVDTLLSLPRFTEGNKQSTRTKTQKLA
ncbi:hypothetical protein ZIOFF_026640 [Zingiber officinale]|uniref:protein-serine/threonine phosphatase n=2 Tax=Zingiber officinale TaxID=94328 RepID=A0A8J5H5B1_ZINOF|nr:hypothetical protein ZIOFF_026640 [Zingiber officinale]